MTSERFRTSERPNNESGLAALVNGFTGSAELAWIAFVALFAFCLFKSDSNFS